MSNQDENRTLSPADMKFVELVIEGMAEGWKDLPRVAETSPFAEIRRRLVEDGTLTQAQIRLGLGLRPETGQALPPA